MNRTWPVIVTLALAGCVARRDYDGKAQEAEAAKKQAASLEAKAAELQQEHTADQQQIDQLKGALGLAQSQAITDDQKSQLEEAKRAMQEAHDRGKLLEDLQTKFKKMIDAGHLKVTTRHGRAVLQLHNDVLFAPGEAEVKPEGKQALTEVAAALKQVGPKRFQVAGHTDSQPITTDKKKDFPTNWELSTARAIAVVKLLIAQGVDPAVVSAAGYGPYDPVASNATPEGEAKNRRIEITLMPHVTELLTTAQNEKK